MQKSWSSGGRTDSSLAQRHGDPLKHSIYCIRVTISVHSGASPLLSSLHFCLVWFGLVCSMLMLCCAVLCGALFGTQSLQYTLCIVRVEWVFVCYAALLLCCADLRGGQLQQVNWHASNETFISLRCISFHFIWNVWKIVLRATRLDAEAENCASVLLAG